MISYFSNGVLLSGNLKEVAFKIVCLEFILPFSI